MLNMDWVRRLSPSARRLMVFGDTEAARQMASATGLRASRHDLSELRSTPQDADGLIIDTGREDATLEEAARTAAQTKAATIGVVVESWAGFTAALALDASLGVRGTRVRPLSMSERRVRATLSAHPWWRLRHAGRPSTAIIFGTGPLAEHLVIALFRSMHLTRQSPQVVVVAPDAGAWVAALARTLPQLQEIGALVGTGRAPDLDGAGVIYATANSTDPATYPRAVPLVWLSDAEAPSHALAGAAADWRQLAKSLFGDPEDARAQAIHDFYFESALRDGNLPGSRPSMLPWADLPERFRQASRYQADHVPAKLAAIGCRQVATPERWRFRFSAAEVDALARVEHERWSAVQLLDGWRHGESRDDAARLTPFLRPYDELAPEIQDRDRMPVRQIPAQLARIGHGVKRDMIVTLTAEAGAEPGFTFAFLFRSLLADIARRYPDRQLALVAPLHQEFGRRVAKIVLDEKVPFHALLGSDQTVPPEADALVARADRILVMTEGKGPPETYGNLHIHIGDKPIAMPRLILLDAYGNVQSAPWL